MGSDRVRREIDAVVDGQTVPSMFLATVAEHPDAVALRARCDDGSWESLTFRSWADAVALAAGVLRAVGVGAGDRVVLMTRNRPGFYVADLAALFLGATPISIYNSSSPEQVAYQAAHSGAVAAIVEPEFLDHVLAARREVASLRHVLSIDELGAGHPVDLEEAGQAARPDDLATVIYTSGTTGPPKGVMLSHRNVAWTVECYARTLDVDPLGLRVISYLPMAHIAARITTYYQALARGYEVTTCPDMGEIEAYIAEVHPHVIFGVPRMWQKLRASVRARWSAEDCEALDTVASEAVSLRRAAAAGELSAMQREALERLDARLRPVLEEIGLDACRYAVIGATVGGVDVIEWYRGLGVPMSEIYGLSESCGPLTWDTTAANPGTVGRAMPGITIRLAPDGEVLATGGNVFQGYLDDPERTAEALDDDGWLHTGDIGVWDDGHLRIVDRKKELLITAGGKNVSPSNLEAALVTVPLVGQACVLGDGRPYLVALVTLDVHAASAWAEAHGRAGASVAELAVDPEVEAEVASGVAAVMARFSRPERVKKVRILPEEWLPDSDELTPTSKLKRRAIAAKYAEELDALYR